MTPLSPQSDTLVDAYSYAKHAKPVAIRNEPVCKRKYGLKHDGLHISLEVKGLQSPKKHASMVECSQSSTLPQHCNPPRPLLKILLLITPYGYILIKN